MADPSGPAEVARLHAVTIIEHDQLAVLEVICAAEELLAAVRFVELLELQVAARVRHADAELQLVEALKVGSRDWIVAGQRAAAAEAESQCVCREGGEEMAEIVEAGADRFDLVVGQYGRWADAADAEFYARLRAG
jgi:hypothetical protein